MRSGAGHSSTAPTKMTAQNVQLSHCCSTLRRSAAATAELLNQQMMTRGFFQK